MEDFKYIVTIVLFIVNGLLGFAMWLLKQAYTDLKDQIKKHDQDIVGVKDHYFKKEDFREFKEELWRRFDKLENKVDKKASE